MMEEFNLGNLDTNIKETEMLKGNDSEPAYFASIVDTHVEFSEVTTYVIDKIKHWVNGIEKGERDFPIDVYDLGNDIAARLINELMNEYSVDIVKFVYTLYHLSIENDYWLYKSGMVYPRFLNAILKALICLEPFGEKSKSVEWSYVITEGEGTESETLYCAITKTRDGSNPNNYTVDFQVRSAPEPLFPKIDKPETDDDLLAALLENPEISFTESLSSLLSSYSYDSCPETKKYDLSVVISTLISEGLLEVVYFRGKVCYEWSQIQKNKSPNLIAIPKESNSIPRRRLNVLRGKDKVVLSDFRYLENVDRDLVDSVKKVLGAKIKNNTISNVNGKYDKRAFALVKNFVLNGDWEDK